MWKVIATDNLDRDYINDLLIEDNLTEEEAIFKARMLNIESDDYSDWYYQAVPKERKLHIIES